ncbi:hypothetical protein ABXZ75_003769 [Klebsiella variicola]|nr:hypothetical protein [Klebsiella variicola]HBZ8007297.1 hypothetical protein [Klebsiella variicola subsp. variicola]HCB0895307.1 hypothetical protein [Klebsiella variicola subsp. variicola]HCB0912291.1 hypothetical protein [Klebsiella variicola subsp. variicola]HCB4012278.1 hypothetical protein [Klebsiella variicola subsp. variicola]
MIKNLTAEDQPQKYNEEKAYFLKGIGGRPPRERQPWLLTIKFCVKKDINVLSHLCNSELFRRRTAAFTAIDTRFFRQRIFFIMPLDNMFFFRLFSKRAATAAASLGRSGR